MLLFGIGLFGLAGFRRKMKNRRQMSEKALPFLSECPYIVLLLLAPIFNDTAMILEAALFHVL